MLFIILLCGISAARRVAFLFSHSLMEVDWINKTRAVSRLEDLALKCKFCQTPHFFKKG